MYERKLYCGGCYSVSMLGSFIWYNGNTVWPHLKISHLVPESRTDWDRQMRFLTRTLEYVMNNVKTHFEENTSYRVGVTLRKH